MIPHSDLQATANSLHHDDAPPAPDIPPWLAQWPAAWRSRVANLFYTAVRTGRTDPALIVDAVLSDLCRRLQGSTAGASRDVWHQAVRTIQADRAAAHDYAAAVLAREQLPAAAKAARQAQAAKAFVLEAMRGKPATPKQVALRRSLGYPGPFPTDRAEASVLIASLLPQTGGRHV